MSVKGKYGAAWDQYQVEHGQVWDCGPHAFLCEDLVEAVAYGKLDEMVSQVDYVYTDPPWNIGFKRKFEKYAGKASQVESLEDLISVLALVIRTSVKNYAWVEMGKVFGPKLVETFKNYGLYCHGIASIAYDSGTYSLMAFSQDSEDPVLLPDESIKGKDVPRWVAGQVGTSSLLDPFVGAGFCVSPAAEAGATTYGVELIPRKMASCLTRYEKMGYTPMTRRSDG